MYNNDYNNNQQNNGYQTLHQIDFQEFLRKQNGEQRIHMLEMEIAKSTDDLVRARLEKMLRQEIARQKQQRRRYIIASVLIFIFIIIAAIVVFAKVKNMNNTVSGAEPANPQTQQEILTTNSTNDEIRQEGTNPDAAKSDSTVSSAENNNTNTNIDTLNLTEKQLIDWTFYHFTTENSYYSKNQNDYRFDIFNNADTSEINIMIWEDIQAGQEPNTLGWYFVNTLGELVKYDSKTKVSNVIAVSYDVPY